MEHKMNHLENGFRLLAVGCAMSYGYGFTPDCQMHVNDMIRNGCVDLGENPSAQKINKAQMDLVKFISKMVEEAKNKNLPELQELTFFSARNFLCPLPPWIKGPC